MYIESKSERSDIHDIVYLANPFWHVMGAAWIDAHFYEYHKRDFYA